MSIKFDNQFIAFNKWYRQHRETTRSVDMDVKFLQDAFDKAIGLIECANDDLKAYEGGTKGVLTI